MVPMKLLPHSRAFCPRSPPREALPGHPHPLSTLLSLPGFIFHDSSSHGLEPGYLCLLITILLSKCEPCQVRGLFCVTRLCISPGTEERLGVGIARNGCSFWMRKLGHFRGLCSGDPACGPALLLRLPGGAQGGEPRLPRAGSDACRRTVFGPALPLRG